jgi:hypothetical protein
MEALLIAISLPGGRADTDKHKETLSSPPYLFSTFLPLATHSVGPNPAELYERTNYHLSRPIHNTRENLFRDKDSPRRVVILGILSQAKCPRRNVLGQLGTSGRGQQWVSKGVRMGPLAQKVTSSFALSSQDIFPSPICVGRLSSQDIFPSPTCLDSLFRPACH